MQTFPAAVLVLEPQPLMRANLCAILAAESDLTVISCSALGANAIEQARTLNPALILLALGSPGLEGLQIIRALREIAPAASILALTPNEQPGQEQAALAAGAQAVLTKAASRAELIAALHALFKASPSKEANGNITR